MKVLLVDDDEAFSASLKELLRLDAVEADAAKDGVEALLKLRANGYSLMVLDLMMPNRNGWELLDDMQNLGIKTPVIVASSYVSVPEPMPGNIIGTYEKPCPGLAAEIVSQVRRLAAHA